MKAVAIDIYNNDIHLTGDDFIEADGGVHNIRVMRNRGVNAAHTALSAQPVFGGPAYFIRNVVYNAPTALKFMAQAGRADRVSQHGDRGEPEYADIFERALPQQPVSGDGWAGARDRSLSECDGVLDLRLRRLPSEPRRRRISIIWIAPPKGQLRDYEVGARQAQRFKTLAELAAATGAEAHGVELDYDIFEKVKPPDPKTPHAVYHAADFDFRLEGGKQGSGCGDAVA